MIRIILMLSKRVKLDLWRNFFFRSTMYLDLFCMSTRKRLLAHQIVTALRVLDDYLRHSTYLVIGHENFGWTNSCSVSQPKLSSSSLHLFCNESASHPTRFTLSKVSFFVHCIKKQFKHTPKFEHSNLFQPISLVFQFESLI